VYADKEVYMFCNVYEDCKINKRVSVAAALVFPAFIAAGHPETLNRFVTFIIAALTVVTQGSAAARR
jgi:hypothetical protein